MLQVFFLKNIMLEALYQFWAPITVSTMESYRQNNASRIAVMNEAKKVMPQAFFVPLRGVTLTKFESNA